MLAEILIFGLGSLAVFVAVLLLASASYKRGYVDGYSDALRSLIEMLKVKEAATGAGKRRKREAKKR